MNCERCPNRKQKYFECSPVIQNLLMFSDLEQDYINSTADITVVEFVRIMCKKR
jgi:hypothetical protein